MELPTPPQNSAEPQKQSIEEESLEGGISLFLRLWSYGSPTLPPSGLVVEQDAEIAELIHEIVVEGKGKIAQRQPELWSLASTIRRTRCPRQKRYSNGF